MITLKKNYVLPLAIASLLGIVFLFFLYLNSKIPYYADDYMFLNKDAPGLLATVKDFYFGWSGCFAEIFLIKLLFSIGNDPAILINILSAIASLFYVLGIFYLAQSKKLKDIDLYDIIFLVFIIGIVWFFLPEFNGIFLWKDTQIVYLMPITATLYLVYPFIRLIFNENIIKNNLIINIGMVVCSFFLAAFLANMSAAISLFFMAVLAYQLIRKAEIPTWAYSSSIAYWLGTVILIAAPGNYARARVIHDHTPFLQKIFPFLNTIYHHYFESHLLLLYALAWIFYFVDQKRPDAAKRSLVLFALAFFTGYAMIGAPGINFTDRTTFCSDTFFIAAIISLLPKPNMQSIKVLFILLALLTTSTLIPSAIATTHYWEKLNNIAIARDKLAQEAKRNGIDDPILPSLSVDETIMGHPPKNIFLQKNHKILGGYDINVGPGYWTNTELAAYYHLKAVQGAQVIAWKELAPYLTATPKNQFTAILKDNTVYYILLGSSCYNIPDRSTFFLHIFGGKIGYANGDWGLGTRSFIQTYAEDGTYYKDRCVVGIALPDYLRQKVETGQYSLDSSNKTNGIKIHWEKVFGSPEIQLLPWKDLAPYVKTTHKDQFTAFRKDNKLYYVLMSNSCNNIPDKSTFFLHFYGKTTGYVNNDWVIGTQPFVQTYADDGTYYNDRCIIGVTLPNYPLTKIETGQFSIRKISALKIHWNKIHWRKEFLTS